MKKLYASIIALILLAPILACCQSNTEPAGDSVKTGDIMVVAHGCTAPPYEYGLKLVLNRMPEVEEPVIKIPIPDSLKGDDRLFRLANDTLIKPHISLLNAVIDTAENYILIKQNIYYYYENQYSEGITDSLGHYIFTNVPIGKYQLILSEVEVYDTGVATSNSRYADLTDFPEYHPYHPNTLKNYLKQTAGGWEARKRNDYVSIHNIVCKVGVIIDVEVKEDRISIVKIAQIIYDTKSMRIFRAKQWDREFKERGN